MATRFQVLEQGKNFEVRKYPPRKRFVSIAGREYWLPFPYIVFGWRLYSDCSYLYLGFAKEDDESVFFPAIPNVIDPHWCLCLGRHDGHYRRPEKDMESMIARFWQTSFDSTGMWPVSERSLKVHYGSFHAWQALSKSEAVACLDDKGKKEKLEAFVKRVKETPSSSIQR